MVNEAPSKVDMEITCPWGTEFVQMMFLHNLPEEEEALVFCNVHDT
jgi:hypothetical protein